MSRWTSINNQAQAALNATYIVILADMVFGSGNVFVHDGMGELSFNGNTYSGLGEFGAIELVEENFEQIARGVRATLSGPSDVLAKAMGEKYQGLSITFFIGLLTDTYAWADTPEEIWAGRMDRMTIELGPASSTITLDCEYRLRKEPPVARYTNADQQIEHAGDKFFEFVTAIPNFRSMWGDKPSVYIAPGTTFPTVYGPYGPYKIP